VEGDYRSNDSSTKGEKSQLTNTKGGVSFHGARGDEGEARSENSREGKEEKKGIDIYLK